MAKNSSLFGFVESRPYRGGGAEDALRGRTLAKQSLSLLQRLSLLHTLDSHKGCVNTICWNASGTHLLSGSDDHRLVVTEPYSKRVVVDFHTRHRANIFSAKFVPETCDLQIVSCAGDGTLLFTDLERITETAECTFNCHYGTTYEVVTLPGDPHSFLSCGEDGTVRWFDLRTKEKCDKSSCKEDVLITCRDPVTSVAIDPTLPFRLAVGSSDSTVRIFDRRMLGTRSTSGQTRERSLEGLVARFSVPSMSGGKKQRRITAVDYRPDGKEVLVSYSSDYIYIFDPSDHDVTKSTRLFVGNPDSKASPSVAGKRPEMPPAPPMKRLRLRGDWSDTGPNARPERDLSPRVQSPGDENSEGASSDSANEPIPGPSNASQAEEDRLQGNLMQRMTDALSRMLNDPSTQAAMRSIRTGRETAERSTSTRDRDSPGDSTDATSRPSDTQDASNDRETDPSSARDLQSDGGDMEERMPSNAREGLDDRPSSEPEISLRHGTQGSETSTISIQRSSPSPRQGAAPSADPHAGEYRTDLPGPSQVVTDPGSSLEFPSQAEVRFEEQELIEYEEDRVDADSDPEDDEPSDEVERVRGARSRINRPSRRVVPQPGIKKVFRGHRNARTMIKEATWWGNDFVLSGSDCGHVFGWERASGRLVLLLEADRHVVNCIQPHPFDPILATSGIDYNVKMWAPNKEEPTFNEELANMLVDRNEVMLEETRDTITVPATLMIRMLASLNQIRRSRTLPQRFLDRVRSAENETERNDASQNADNPAAATANQDIPEELQEEPQENEDSEEL